MTKEFSRRRRCIRTTTVSRSRMMCQGLVKRSDIHNRIASEQGGKKARGKIKRRIL